jgi:hypothetical protein
MSSSLRSSPGLASACILASALLLQGCSSSSDSPAPIGLIGADADLPEAEEDAEVDASADDAQGGEDGSIEASDPEASAPEGGITIPATQTLFAVPFGIDATGVGQKRLDELSIKGDQGTIRLSGVDHAAVAYTSHDWGEAGFVLYDLVSIANDGSNLAVTYLYCNGSELQYAYTESLVDPMDWESTTGGCKPNADPVAVKLALPALRTEPVAMDTGIQIQGADLTLDAAGGTAVLEGKTWTLVPFNTVDCSKDCPGGSWYEIHTMLMGDQEGCFAILYLFPDQPQIVQLSYGFCMPSAATPSAEYDASWSGTLQAKAAPMMWRPKPPLPGPTTELHRAWR